MHNFRISVPRIISRKWPRLSVWPKVVGIWKVISKLLLLRYRYYPDDFEAMRASGCGDGSVVRGTGCSSRGPQFSSQHPHSAQPALCDSSSRGSGTLFWSPQMLYTCGAHTYMQTNKQYTWNKINFYLKRPYLGLGKWFTGWCTKCLLYRHEGLSSTPQHPCETKQVWLSWKSETREYLGLLARRSG